MYKGAPVVYRSTDEIREMIIDWVERDDPHGTEQQLADCSVTDHILGQWVDLKQLKGDSG